MTGKSTHQLSTGSLVVTTRVQCSFRSVEPLFIMKNKITHEELKVTLVYDPNEGVFRRIKTMKIAGTKRKDGRFQIAINNRLYQTHRLAWFYVYGRWPTEIDHIDRNQSNNKISNLREVSRNQNCWNMGMNRRNSSGVKGLSWDKFNNKWLAQVAAFRKTKTLGRFKEKAEAIDALRKYREDLHGAFACHEGAVIQRKPLTT